MSRKTLIKGQQINKQIFFPILLPNCYVIFTYLSPLPLTDTFYKRFIYVSAVRSVYFEVEGARL